MHSTDQHSAEEVVGNAGEEMHLLRRRHDFDLSDGELRPPPHEALGIAVRGVPLRRVVDRFVVVHLHHALLVLRREQRQDGARLVDPAVDPLRAGILRRPVVPAIPLGQRLPRVLRGAAGGDRFGHQRVVMFLGGPVGQAALDVVDRVVDAAVAPFSRTGRAAAHSALRPDVGELARRVAAEISGIRPEILVLVEVLRRK